MGKEEEAHYVTSLESAYGVGEWIEKLLAEADLTDHGFSGPADGSAWPPPEHEIRLTFRNGRRFLIMIRDITDG